MKINYEYKSVPEGQIVWCEFKRRCVEPNDKIEYIGLHALYHYDTSKYLAEEIYFKKAGSTWYFSTSNDTFFNNTL